MEDSTDPKETKKPTHEHNTHESTNDTLNEAKDETLHTFEEQQKRKEHKLQEEIEEYTQMRKEQKERELMEIEDLKRKRIERQKERALEEKRLAEQRKEEDIRRKVEEEERKKKKQEEEEIRRREKERRLEAEKRKGSKTPNFTITKKEGGEVEEEVEKKPPQKSKEELEKHKQAQLASRITPLPDISNMSVNELNELAKDLHSQIWNVVSNMYNLEERYKRTQYDIVELQERARAMSKTKKKGITSVQVDDSYDRMSDKFSNAPPKILVANKYEANVDRRSWKEKVDTFNTKPKILLCSKYERQTDGQSFNQCFKLYEELSADKPLPEMIRRMLSLNDDHGE